MDFFASLFKPKTLEKEIKPTKTVTIEESYLGSNGKTYFRIVKKSLTEEELNKLVVVTNIQDPPPFKNVTSRFANRRAKMTYPIVYVTPERAIQLEAQKKIMKNENEAYAPIDRQKYENEQKRLEIESKNLLSPAILAQRQEMSREAFSKTIGGKRKTRKSKRKARKN